MKQSIFEIISNEKIAKDTGLLKSDVVASLKFWHENGAITLDNNSLTINRVSTTKEEVELKNDVVWLAKRRHFCLGTFYTKM